MKPSLQARLFLLAAPALLACVYPEYREAGETKHEYEACVAEHGADTDACEAEWHAHQAALDRYEANAKRRWSCDPAQAECPTKR